MPDSAAVAVVVTFNPDSHLLQKMFEVLCPECPIIVVDNGSGKDVISGLRQLAGGYPDVTISELGENFGIARAQNHGIELAGKCFPEFRYILTLDHDSVPQPGMCTSLVARAESLRSAGQKPGAIGPLLIESRTGEALKFHRIRGIFWWKLRPRPGHGAIRVDSINSSGTLISRETLEQCGGFDESMFIDHVETEWCFRVLHHGFGLFVDQDVTMDHELGDDVVTSGKFIKFSMPYRGPRRHYTIFRNSIYLQRKGYIPLVWKLWNIIKLAFTFFYFGFLAHDSSEQRHWIRRGIRDGMRGEMGGYPPD